MGFYDEKGGRPQFDASQVNRFAFVEFMYLVNFSWPKANSTEGQKLAVCRKFANFI
jgi:hypothetical protein